MPTVRCPSCQRALNLPDYQHGGDARCPLCHTTFPTASPQSLDPATSYLPPIPLTMPTSQARPETKEPTPFDFEEPNESESLSRPDRHALRSASNWLKAHAGIGIVHMFTCGCVNVLAFGALTGVGGELYLTGAILDVLLRLVAFGVIAAGADSMERRRSRALATTAAVLAPLMGVYLLVPAFLLLTTVGGRGRSSLTAEETILPACFSLLLTILVAVLGVVGGIRSLVLLNKPEVLRAFSGAQRPGQGP
jgi:hypothetical protein